MARLSVLTSTYNHARYLPAMVEAVTAQSWLPDEFLVADDASPDETSDVLRDLAQKHPLLQPLRNERNLGVCRSYNALFERATGDYLFAQGSDDFLLPGAIEALMRAAEAHPQAGMAYGGRVMWNMSNGAQWELDVSLPDRDCYLSPAECVALARRGILTLGGDAAFFKRSVLIECGSFREELRWYTDWFLAWTIAFRHGIAWTPHRCTVRRLHDGCYSHPSKLGPEACLPVYRALADLLGQEEFCDVRSAFAQSGLFAGHGALMGRVLLEKPSRWSLLSREFIASHLRTLLRRSAPLKRIVRLFRPAPKSAAPTDLDFSSMK